MMVVSVAIRIVAHPHHGLDGLEAAVPAQLRGACATYAGGQSEAPWLEEERQAVVGPLRLTHQAARTESYTRVNVQGRAQGWINVHAGNTDFLFPKVQPGRAER